VTVATQDHLGGGSTGHRAHVRSPVDVLRIIVGLLLLVGGIAAANVFDSTLLGLSEDGAAAIDGLPDWTHDVSAAALAVGVIVCAVTTLAWALPYRCGMLPLSRILMLT
jgi:hypothetical protein